MWLFAEARGRVGYPAKEAGNGYYVQDLARLSWVIGVLRLEQTWPLTKPYF